MFKEVIYESWPWYISGPLIGLMVPLLLIIGNKQFGISSTLRHISAACIPLKLEYFKYDWRQHSWSLLFSLGIVIGAMLCRFIPLSSGAPSISQNTIDLLSGFGVYDYNNFIPVEILSWNNLFTLKGGILIIVGGFLVGFGTRYANGCTSGHSIMGLSLLSLGSLVATMGFFIGGLLASYFILPLILSIT